MVQKHVYNQEILNMSHYTWANSDAANEVKKHWYPNSSNQVGLVGSPTSAVFMVGLDTFQLDYKVGIIS